MNLYSRIAYLAQCQPSKSAIETNAATLNYAELDSLARRIAALLRSCGAGRGDVIGLRLKDTPAHLASFLAVMRIGATLLPLDFRTTRSEFDRVVAQFTPKLILNDDQPALDWSPAIIDLSRSHGIDPDREPVDDAPGGVFAFNLTSGTTGQPKAIVTTHEQTFARCTARALEGLFLRSDRYLTTLPLAYNAGREHALNPLLLGATLFMFPSLFDPRELIETVNARNVTAFNLSPNMSRAVLALKSPEGRLLMPDVRTMVSTTGKLDPGERAALRKYVVPAVIDYYGSTGTGPIAVMTAETDAAEPTAAGRCVIGIEAQIVDADGNQLPTGEIGRIRVRGPAVTTSVAGASDQSDEAFRDGWYYPGDIGRIAANGILHLAGRSADLIKRGGLMVHAQEIEQVLRRHPDVVDAAVVGAPSPSLGQEVVAFIEVRRPLEPKEITRFCRGQLAGYKIPARIETVDSLPRNSAGKVVKTNLVKSS